MTVTKDGMNKEIYIEDIGLVLFKKNNRAKRILLRVKSETEVVVTVPSYTSLAKAVSFAQENKTWIKKAISKFEEKPNKLLREKRLESLMTDFTIQIGTQSEFQFIRYGRTVVFTIPSLLSLNDKNILTNIESNIIEILRGDAKLYLKRRIQELSRLNMIDFNKLTIKNIKSRWGSCSKNNNINLSLYLMLLPKEIIDYVILHELAHVKIKNHSKHYWDLLIKMNVDAKVLDKELKKFSPKIL